MGERDITSRMATFGLSTREGTSQETTTSALNVDPSASAFHRPSRHRREDNQWKQNSYNMGEPDKKTLSFPPSTRERTSQETITSAQLSKQMSYDIGETAKKMLIALSTHERTSVEIGTQTRDSEPSPSTSYRSSQYRYGDNQLKQNSYNMGEPDKQIVLFPLSTPEQTNQETTTSAQQATTSQRPSQYRFEDNQSKQNSYNMGEPDNKTVPLPLSTPEPTSQETTTSAQRTSTSHRPSQYRWEDNQSKQNIYNMGEPDKKTVPLPLSIPERTRQDTSKSAQLDSTSYRPSHYRWEDNQSKQTSEPSQKMAPFSLSARERDNQETGTQSRNSQPSSNQISRNMGEPATKMAPFSHLTNESASHESTTSAKNIEPAASTSHRPLQYRCEDNQIKYNSGEPASKMAPFALSTYERTSQETTKSGQNNEFSASAFHRPSQYRCEDNQSKQISCNMGEHADKMAPFSHSTRERTIQDSTMSIQNTEPSASASHSTSQYISEDNQISYKKGRCSKKMRYALPTNEGTSQETESSAQITLPSIRSLRSSSRKKSEDNQNNYNMDECASFALSTLESTRQETVPSDQNTEPTASTTQGPSQNRDENSQITYSMGVRGEEKALYSLPTPEWARQESETPVINLEPSASTSHGTSLYKCEDTQINYKTAAEEMVPFALPTREWTRKETVTSAHNTEPTAGASQGPSEYRGENSQIRYRVGTRSTETVQYDIPTPGWSSQETGTSAQTAEPSASTSQGPSQFQCEDDQIECIIAELAKEIPPFPLPTHDWTSQETATSDVNTERSSSTSYRPSEYKCEDNQMGYKTSKRSETMVPFALPTREWTNQETATSVQYPEAVASTSQGPSQYKCEDNQQMSYEWDERAEEVVQYPLPTRDWISQWNAMEWTGTTAAVTERSTRTTHRPSYYQCEDYRVRRRKKKPGRKPMLSTLPTRRRASQKTQKSTKITKPSARTTRNLYQCEYANNQGPVHPTYYSIKIVGATKLKIRRLHAKFSEDIKIEEEEDETKSQGSSDNHEPPRSVQASCSLADNLRSNEHEYVPPAETVNDSNPPKVKKRAGNEQECITVKTKIMKR